MPTSSTVSPGFSASCWMAASRPGAKIQSKTKSYTGA